jgi:hypothetical protein
MNLISKDDVDTFIKNLINLDDVDKGKNAETLCSMFPKNDPRLRCNTCRNKKPSDGWEVIYTDGECYCSSQCYKDKYPY